MSGVLKFIRPGSNFDPDMLTVLGDVHDRACSSLCEQQASPECEEMANRIFSAAMSGERDPDRLWRAAVRELPNKPPGTCT